MASRLKLHEELLALGTKNVYYNPPESLKMRYPAIRYNNEKNDPTYANNGAYLWNRRYEIMILDSDPESELEQKLIEAFPTISHDRNYVSDGMYHYVFTLYY